MNHVIYGLCEPGTKFVRYVGYTKYSVEERLDSHLHEASKENTCHRHRWLRSLLRQGLRPATTVLEQITFDTRIEREKHWIAKLKVSNRLVNSTEGGEGLINPSRAVRRRISRKVSKLLLGNQYALGMKHTEESKAQISASLLASRKFKRSIRNRKPAVVSADSLLKMQTANSGKKFSAEHRAKMCASHTHAQTTLGTRWIYCGAETKLLLPGHRMPAGWAYGRPAVAEANRGNQYGVRNAGKKFSEEHKQNISAALQGNVNLVGVKQGLRKITNGKVAIMLKPNQVMPEGFNYTKGQPLQ